MADLFRHTLHLIDRPLMRLTGGRFNMTLGLPSILLTTMGRKSGVPRSSPLLYVPFEDDIVIIGTRFGGNSHPGWYYNLIAEPKATVLKEGESFEVEARMPSDDERAMIWETADQVYMGFEKYRSRVTEREIPMFVLKRV
ncbi:MAG: nitroreductase family deazaflavin-dependent oxidoreductase [Pseudomonadota bacterium]